MAPPHSRDADLLQVALSEGQKDAEVHVLLLEHLQVLETPDLFQQRGEVLEGKGTRAGRGRASTDTGREGAHCKAEPLSSCRGRSRGLIPRRARLPGSAP